MPTIDMLDTGLIYRNAKPHLVSRHAYFPSLVELSEGRLLAAMDIGSAFEAVDVRSYVCRSEDEGRTWSAPELIFEPDESSHPVSTTCRVARAPDGELVGLACLFDRTLTDEGLANPATNGFVVTKMALVCSTDNGHTWSAPQPINPGIAWRHFETCSPVVMLDARRWFAPTALWPDWQGRQPLGGKAIAFVSEDGGTTWPAVIDVMDGTDQNLTSWEQKMIRLSDRRILAVCWAYDRKAGRNRPNRYALSSDEGRSFGPPTFAPVNGETCTPVALDNNHVLCVYRRSDRPGLWAQLALVDGNRWVTLADKALWGAGDAGINAPGDKIFERLSNLRFGCPSVIRLSAGDILTAFWCVEEHVSNIRWLRLAIQW